MTGAPRGSSRPSDPGHIAAVCTDLMKMKHCCCRWANLRVWIRERSERTLEHDQSVRIESERNTLRSLWHIGEHEEWHQGGGYYDLTLSVAPRGVVEMAVEPSPARAFRDCGNIATNVI